MAVLETALQKVKRTWGVPLTGAKAASLTDLRAGESAVITSLHGGEGFRGKMLSMGLLPGMEITIISGGHGQPFVLKVGGTRLMLGWGMAQKIAVSAMPSAQGGK